MTRRSGSRAPIPMAGRPSGRACSSEHSGAVHSEVLRGTIPACGRMAPGVCAGSRGPGDGRMFRYLEDGPRSRRRRNTSISFAAWRSPFAVAAAMPRRYASEAAAVSPSSVHAFPSSFHAAE